MLTTLSDEAAQKPFAQPVHPNPKMSNPITDIIASDVCVALDGPGLFNSSLIDPATKEPAAGAMAQQIMPVINAVNGKNPQLLLTVCKNLESQIDKDLKQYELIVTVPYTKLISGVFNTVGDLVDYIYTGRIDE